MSVDIERYLHSSSKIQTDDLDWELAAKIGLTDDERFAITYFSDIESQTFRYLRMLLGMKIALQPHVSAFLTMWNYEEFFHGHFLSQLLGVCGAPLEENRRENVKNQAKLNEILEKIFTPVLSHIFSDSFPAVYLSFGAIQEMTTLRGYEFLEKTTANPVLKTLCQRIAKQERRHFAWYYHNAHVELQKSKIAQKLTRTILKFNWVPVGAGVKSEQEVYRLFSFLFPGINAQDVIADIDGRMNALPGLGNMNLMDEYFKNARKKFKYEVFHPYTHEEMPQIKHEISSPRLHSLKNHKITGDIQT